MSSIEFSIKSSHCSKRKNMFTAFRIHFAFVQKPTSTTMGCFAKI